MPGATLDDDAWAQHRPSLADSSSLSLPAVASWRSAPGVLSVGLAGGHRAPTPCVLRLGLLELRLLSIDLFAELGSSRLILHNLRVHVRVADLVLVLLIHLLLLHVLPLLGCGVCRLVCSNVATLVIGKSLLLVIGTGRAASEVSVGPLLLRAEVIVRVLALVGVALRARNAVLAPVLRS